MKNTRRAIWCMPADCAAGFAVIGSYCPGYSPSSTPKTEWLPTACPPSISGKFSTTCGAVFCRRHCWRCSLQVGCSCLAHPGSGLCWCFCLPSCQLLCKLFSTAGTICGKRLPLKQILKPTSFRSHVGRFLFFFCHMKPCLCWAQLAQH